MSDLSLVHPTEGNHREFVVADAPFEETAYVRPWHMLQAQLLFAERMAALTGRAPIDMYTTFTELPFLLRKPQLSTQVNAQLQQLLSSFPLSWQQEACTAFISANRSKVLHVRQNCCGTMGLDIDRAQGIAQWHTLPTWVSPDQPSMFSLSELPRRQRELYALLQHCGDTVQEIHAYSWLFNLDAVLRIFSPSAVLEKTVVRKGYRGLSTWGQFLDKSYNAKPDLISQFLCTATKAQLEDDLYAAFPYQTIAIRVSVSHLRHELEQALGITERE